MRPGRFALLIGLLAAGPAYSQAVDLDSPAVRRALESIRAPALEAHMRFLADDLLEGRGTATAGYDIAARYVATRFAAAGLQPAGTSGWYQPVPLRRADLVRSRARIALIRGTATAELAIDRDFIMGPDTYRASSDVTADVVFAGYGVTALEMEYDDFASVDVRGKIVVVLSGAPPKFPTTLRAHHSNGRVKDANLGAHGAIGVLTIRTPTDEQRSPWDRVVRQSGQPSLRWRDSRGVPDGIDPALEVSATLSRRGAATLFQGAPRSLDDVFRVLESGPPGSFALPMKARIRRASRHSDVSSPNVAGLLPGSDPRRRHEVVVFSAHLDHLGIGTPVDGDSIHNGAFDNATGCAALIEMATAFAHMSERPRRSILFLAVTGEEKGLQGSSYFAANPTVPRDSIVADLNLDMYVMIGKLKEVVAYGAEHSTLHRPVQQAATRLGLRVIQDPNPEEVIFVRSDQYSFVRSGVPSLFLVGRSGSEDDDARRTWRRTTYHSPQDDLSQPMDFETLAQFARVNWLVGWIVAQQSARPAWNPDDFFGERFGTRSAAGTP